MLTVDEFKKYYSDLLIIQYNQLPKAKAQINAIAELYYDIYKIAQQMLDFLNINTQEGVQLDIIGKIIGLSRDLPNVLPADLFGMSDLFTGDFADNRFPMGDLFVIDQGKPFNGLFDNQNNDQILTDTQYRLLLKAKVLVNVVKSTLVSDDDSIDLNQAILQAFDGLAYLIDNSNMSMTLFIDNSVTNEYVNALWDVGLIAKPMGVGYIIIKQDLNSDNNFIMGDLFGTPTPNPMGDLFGSEQGKPFNEMTIF